MGGWHFVKKIRTYREEKDMNEFVVLNENEIEELNGGGVASAFAGTLAGALIGTFVSLPYAAYKGDASIIGHAAIMGGSVGMYVGAGCPLP